MGKIVKYCAACEESFAEKFAFCPNCGQAMTAFEMNPVNAGVKSVSEPAPGIENGKAAETDDILEIPASAPVLAETAPIIEASPRIEKSPKIETVKTAETESFSAANQTQPAFDEIDISDDVKTADAILADNITPETKTFAAAAGANGNGNQYQTKNFYHQETPKQINQTDDDFHVTVIEEKNVKQRNALLLGTMVLMLMLLFGGTVYSLFHKEIGIGAIEDGSLFAFVPVVEDVPMDLEEPPKQKDPGKGGGGGGGGRQDDAPISKGELPPQFKDKPLLTPSKEDISVSNPSLAVIRGTRGPNDIIPKNRSSVNGDPNSSNLTPSNGLSADNLGMGQNGSGGIGNNGRDGVGSNGIGGIGNSPGGRYGNNPGDGGNNIGPPPPPKPAEVVTVPFRIISKPRPGYTDAARQNQVTGVVRLRVTFSASGAIGSIAPVSGLPYGLTEQAIAAARQIKFEPQKKNGAAVAVTKIIEYSFSIY